MSGKAVYNSYSKNSEGSGEKEQGGKPRALSLEKLTLGPKRKLLVLPLGGILCDRINCKDPTRSFPTHRLPDAAYGSYSVYKRPHCQEFLRFCLDRFEVGIWSTAREWYTESALDCMTDHGLRSRLLFVWTQDYCTETCFPTLHNKNKPIFLKELKKVWNHRWDKGRFTSSTTLMIEDEPYKALLNPPNTAIFLREYKVDDIADSDLGPNSELRRYLNGLVLAPDVPSYVRENPFGQPALTDAHPNWEYYSRIIRIYKSE